MPPIVSVILPTYNREKTLPRAIHSVLSQTFQSWELLIWDDGSTDSTHQVVSGYSDPRIRYFFAENRGVAYARNRAMDAATGKYLAFLDSDDEWLPEKLARQVSILESNPEVDVLFGDFLNINLLNGASYRVFYKYAPVMAFLDVEYAADDLFIIKDSLMKSIALDNFIATDTVILRKTLIDRIGGFCEDLMNWEDFELWWRMDLAGVRFAYLNCVYLKRYKSVGALSSSGIVTCQNALKGLDYCAQQALSHDRPDLVVVLNAPYRNAWQNMISLYGKSGKKKEAFRAFAQSLKYGFRLGTVRLFLQIFISDNYGS